MNFYVKAIRKIEDLESVKPYEDQLIDFNYWHLIEKNKKTEARSEFFQDTLFTA